MTPADTTYDVRVWGILENRGTTGKTYTIRWTVAGRIWRCTFKTAALADSFRADLLTAQRRGEAFDRTTGRPVSMARTSKHLTWYAFACAYADAKWPRVAATTRRTHAEALTAITTLLFTTERGKPTDKLLRTALKRWAFNTARRDDPACPDDIRAALRWAADHTRQVSVLRDPTVLRRVLDGLTVKLDGGPGAATVTSRRRNILHAALEYAVELELLDTNPIPALKWTPPKTTQQVDRRRVVNPIQARTLLRAVGEVAGGNRLVAFFGCLYFAALRPEEAASLHKHHLSLPAEGWGQLHLEGAEPFASGDWTDSGHSRDQRQLKHRARGETRIAPCPPELTALLHAHLATFSTRQDGHLFGSARDGGALAARTVIRVWQRARQATFTAEVAASPLAKSPYDLRHAAVSTWLNGGVPPTTVAEWAGHSVEVLLAIYAKCLDRSDALIRARVQAALGHPGTGSGKDAGASHRHGR
jgi:site-specific recombinase XerD